MKNIENIYYNKTTRYTSKWSNYFDVYERHLEKFVNNNPIVLEIGVDNGGSLQMWYEYFGKGTMLIGIDNRPKFDYDNTVEYLGFPANLFVGNQGDENFLEYVIQNSPKFDVIVDDGSHMQNHQILTFKKLWPHVSEGGVYIMEDTHASYMPIFGGKRGDNNTFIEWSKFIVDTLHEDHDSTSPEDGWQDRYDPLFYRSMYSIHYYDSVVVIEKKLRLKNCITYSNRDKAI